MFETYKPSGRFGVATIPLWLVALLLTAPLAALYVAGLVLIPWIYVSFLLTVCAGWVMGQMAQLVCQWGHNRSTLFAWLVGLSLPAAFLICKYIIQWQIWAVEDPNIGFVEHLSERVATGWNIGRRGNGLPIVGVFVYVIWLIEAGLIFKSSPFTASTQAKQAYSEPLSQWASEHERIMLLPVSNEAMITQIESASNVDQLLEIPIPKSDESTKFAVYDVHSIPGQEMEDAYLSVSMLDLIAGTDGEVKQRLTSLVENAVLTTAQRHQLVENASLLNEALAEYRKAQKEEFAAASEGEQIEDIKNLGT